MKRTYKQQTFHAGDDVQELIDFVFEHVDTNDREIPGTTNLDPPEVSVELDAKYIIQITKIEP